MFNEWQSTNTSNPDENGHYLVCINRIAPNDLGGNQHNIKILRFHNGKWIMPIHFPKQINDVITETVTHWMNLPKLPQLF